jgi:hypothetical protein
MPQIDWNSLPIPQLAALIVGVLSGLITQWYSKRSGQSSTLRPEPSFVLAGAESGSLNAMADAMQAMSRQLSICNENAREIALMRSLLQQALGVKGISTGSKTRKPSDPRKDRDRNIRRYIKAGWNTSQIMRKLKCSRPVVNRIRAELKA